MQGRLRVPLASRHAKDRSMLKIAIDATAIPPQRVGAGNYIFHLVQGLSRVDPENQYFVFAKPNHIAEWNIQQPNFRFFASASPLRFFRLIWEQSVLPWLVQKHNVDVLHGPHYSLPLLNPGRSVVTFCDMIFFLYPELHSLSKRIFFQQMMRVSARRADKIITISESTARDLLHFLGDQLLPDKVRAIPLAVSDHFKYVNDPARVARICAQYGLQARDFILFVGVLEPRKNIPTLLHAYRDLLDRGFRQQLAVVGRPGWMFDDIFTTVKSLKLEAHVVFTGYVSVEDLPYLYHGARVFVYPSIYEGFGLPVLEAMACGTPVVTSNVSSLPEIVGQAGLLVDPRDPGQLAQAIERLVVDDDLHRSLQECSRQRAAQFSWERTARETLRVYSSVCGSSR